MKKSELKIKIEQFLKENDAEFAKRLDDKYFTIPPITLNDEFYIYICANENNGECNDFCIHGYYLERDDNEIVFEHWFFDTNEHYWNIHYYEIILGVVKILEEYKKEN